MKKLLENWNRFLTESFLPFYQMGFDDHYDYELDKPKSLEELKGMYPEITEEDYKDYLNGFDDADEVIDDETRK